jgi:hypothetical protein
MIVTSNRSPRDWYSLFPNPVLAESALDRLVNSAHHVFFKGRTYRPLPRPDGGGATTDPEDEPEGNQTGRTLQTRANVRAQETPDEDPTIPEPNSEITQPTRGGRRPIS